MSWRLKERMIALLKTKKKLAGLIALVAVAAVILIVWNRPETKKPIEQREQIVQQSLTVERVQLGNALQYYETSGTVKANVVSKVAPKAMGQVTALYVKAGDRVRAGQVLAELQDEEILQKISAAEAGVREAQKGLQVAVRNRSLQKNTSERYEELYRQGAISQQQVDEVRTQNDVATLLSEQAQAAMERAMASEKEARTYSKLVAPVSGIVTEKNLELGSMALPGVWALVVEDDQSFLVECYVDGALSSQLQVGGAALAEVEGAGENLQGQIIELTPAVDAASRSFLVKVALPGAALKTGMYSKIRFPLGERQAVLLPQESLVAKGQLIGVYVMDANKKLWYRLVRTGRKENGRVEIVSGVQPGEYVVVRGVEAASDGTVAGEVLGL